MKFFISATCRLLTLSTILASVAAAPANTSDNALQIVNSTLSVKHDVIDCYAPHVAPTDDCGEAWELFIRSLFRSFDKFLITKFPVRPDAIRVPKTKTYGRCTMRMDLRRLGPAIRVSRGELSQWGTAVLVRCFGRLSSSSIGQIIHYDESFASHATNELTIRFTIAADASASEQGEGDDNQAGKTISSEALTANSTTVGTS